MRWYGRPSGTSRSPARPHRSSWGCRHARAACNRPSERSRPSSSSDSNSGGLTRLPVTAMRTGPKALRGLSPRPSTSASRRAASIASVVQSSSSDERVVRRPDDLAPAVVDLVGRHERLLVDEEEAEHRHRLGQGVDPLVHQRHRGDEQLTLVVGDRLVDEPRLVEERDHALGHVRHGDAPHVRAVDRLELLHVEACGVRVDPAYVERLGHLLHREDVAVVGDAPAEQGEVVEQSLGQEAAVDVLEQPGARVTLGQLAVALAHHHRQVAEARRPAADTEPLEGLVERDLARGRGEQVLAAQHVGDPHHRVVERVDERVQRVTVGAQDREVGDVLGEEAHLAAHQVVPDDRVLGHPEAEHRQPALGLPDGELVGVELAAEAVVPLRLRAAGLVDAPRPRRWCSSSRTPRPRRAASARPRRRSGTARTGGRARCRRRPRGPRPSRCRASSASR